MKLMLRSWPLAEQIAFFNDELGLELTEEPETGKLFPASNKARDVRDGLVRVARAAGAELRFEQRVIGLEPAGAGWRVSVAGQPPLEARAVVVAAGGLSVPATGSDGTGLELVRRLGHTVHATYPALTPLTADPAPYAELAGISPVVTLEAPVGKHRYRSHGGFLFTHRGYSGPAVLDLSHLAVQSRMRGEHQPLFVQWAPLGAAEWEEALGAGGTGTVANVVRRHLPNRLADALLAEAGVEDTRTLAQLRREERVRLITALTRHPLPWTGDEGYKKAEVTGGGVALGEVDPRTMESKLHPALFLCGEILDTFGPIGGYNFLWAWATGRAAGRAAGAGGVP